MIYRQEGAATASVAVHGNAVGHRRPRRALRAALVGAALLMAAGTASAHHSYGMFDMTKQQVITGTVVSFEWTNPHSWLHVAATGPGPSQVWDLEMASPGILSRTGWKRTTLKPGDKIEVTIHPLRDGSAGGSFLSGKTAEGKALVEPGAPAAAPAPGQAAGKAGA